jgi:hypothetical protein
LACPVEFRRDHYPVIPPEPAKDVSRLSRSDAEASASSGTP